MEKKIENIIKLLGARCLVKEIKNDAEVDGIIIPGREKEQTNHGIVLAVGEGALLESGQLVPMKVKPGDHVLYSSFSGAPVKVSKEDDNTYLILNERDIYCVVCDL